ncbi:hypothetical protein BEL04_01230 [Mucilaginibacter sp. PPCGB 2223]|uniref:lamin tail domain-containing protein n=1 Tax=Mucilaginibacter sp. PPCGB 2223 TaxID=1886027 RepID=UPI0008261C5B|nr:lamin tail domain-containing protein [Mucilaginibacter sp. PPCGB 2223]OCX52979.1 hypothetical protein BEL04_01230 [Mucilaginibacter sp. PPCGB 2223]
MKKTLLYLFYSLLFLLPTQLMAQIANHVVISQVYGGGGNTNAVFTNDFVELYNPTSNDVVMTNWSLQYASAAGTAWGVSTSSTIAPFSGTIKAHGYFLIGLAAGTTVTNKPLPTTDATGPINMSAAAGKIALVNNSTQISQVANPTDASIVDLLGFYTSGGATVTTGFETAYLTIPSTVTSNTWAAQRIANATSTAASLSAGGADASAGNGWDSNNNSTDFVVQTTIVPKNSATPIAPALGSPTPTLSANPTSLDFGTTQTVGTTSAAKNFSLSGTNIDANGVSLSVAAPYSISSSSTGTYGTSLSFTQAQMASAQTVYVEFTPTNTTAAPGSVSITSAGASTQTVTLTGTGAAAVTPTLSANPTSLDFGTTQTVGTTSAAKSFSLSGTNIGSGGVSLSVAAPYSISSSATGTYGTSLTFTQAQMASAQTVYVEFAPTTTTAAPGSIGITSTGATAQTVSLTGTGAAATSTGANHVVISQLYGGNGNTYSFDFIELYNPTSADVDMSNWSLQYNSATGTGAFSGLTTFTSGTTIKAHSYFLVQEQGTAGTGTGTSPTADLTTSGTTNNFNMSGTAGKIALVNGTTLLSAPPTLPSAAIIDFVGYGTTAAYYEGSAAAPAPSSTTSIIRKASATSTASTLATGGSEATAGNGYDTDNNGSDFVVASTINLRTSATPAAPPLGPSLALAPTSLTFSQTVGTTSAAQSFTITGSSLTAGATVTTSAPYAVSTSATGTYSTSVTFTQSQLSSAQTVYVQFTPTAAGPASGSVTVASTGATSQSVTLNGTGTTAAAPTLSATPATLTFSQSVGSTSAAQSFSVSGTNIPSTGVTVTVAAPYAIATSAAGTYGTSITFTQAQMAAAQTVYVQFTPAAVGAANGTVTIASTGATSQPVTLNGTGLVAANTPPTLSPISNVTLCYTPVQQTIALSGITPGAESAQTVVLSISSSNPALFSQLGAFPIAGGTTGQINYTIAPNASGTAVVTVTVKDNGGIANGGIDTYTTNFNITVNSLPNVNIVSNVGTNITKGVTAQLTATAGGTTYAWTPAADIISGQNTATVTVRPKASETFTVVVTNASGCSTTQTISLNVSTLYPLVTSNIITPNGDGKNDTWIIKNIDYYPTSSVKVVDKAGKVVFSATNYLNDWDGTYNGQPLTQGTYYYVIDLGTGAPKYTGYVTIIRD